MNKNKLLKYRNIISSTGFVSYLIWKLIAEINETHHSITWAYLFKLQVDKTGT